MDTCKCYSANNCGCVVDDGDAYGGFLSTSSGAVKKSKVKHGQ